ncbi:glycine-rich domain-containing protein [Mycobacterium sp. NPDC050041]|uniref:glycine-rich domain-containing protein n=1 Tax=Mycobacterium sp. NPDC050041 TaxID=3364293 RepID=UPI003C2C41DD
MRRRRVDPTARARSAVARLELPPAVFKTCPWQPRELVETGLRQWLRCCAAALRDDQVIGMPSHAADEAWHGFILCTARYSAFCEEAYGRFLHHHPEGGGPPDARHDSLGDQLRRTVVAWSMVADPGEQCVLWDLDRRVGVSEPWGLDPGRVTEIEAAVAGLR